MNDHVGYSGKSLVQKLGYFPGDTVYVFGGSDEFSDYLLNENLVITDLPASWVHGFFMSRVDIKIFLHWINLEKIQKGLWMSWPKKSSGIETDVSEQTFRDIILPLGWVDTKVCAIDNIWSGLKFVLRKN